jgi:DNA mismatch repair ATPase MutS
MDKQTAAELEIFHAEEGGQSVFELLDFTVTDGGSFALRRRFNSLLTSVEQIKRTQKSIQYFIRHYEAWHAIIHHRDILNAEEYLRSNIVPLENNRSGFWYIAFRFKVNYPDLYHSLQYGVKTLLNGMCNMSKTLETIFDDDTPDIVGELQRSISYLLGANEIVKTLAGRPVEKIGMTAVMKLDGAFRKTYKVECDRLVAAIYEIDALLSMANATQEYRLTFPVVSETEKMFTVKNLRHLFLPIGIGNDLEITGENFIFLTGPNMSGKSTFIKALGLLVYLAHIGMAIPAAQAQIPFYEDVFTNINVTDNLHTGVSYFFAEVLRLKELGGQLQKTPRVFAVFDELFRGTNLKDAMDCSEMVIEKFLSWKESFFVLASHLTELAEKMKDHAGISFRYFESSVQNDVPVFTYKLREGISDQRLGWLILKHNDVPQLLSHKKTGIQ